MAALAWAGIYAGWVVDGLSEEKRLCRHEYENSRKSIFSFEKRKDDREHLAVLLMRDLCGIIKTSGGCENNL